MKLRNTGKVYKFDKDDCIIAHHPTLNTDTLGQWNSAISSLLKIYDTTNIHSIYIRGSVATDKPINNISDLDVMLVFKIKTHIKDIFESEAYFREVHRVYNDYIVKRYPFITKVDFSHPVDSEIMQDEVKFVIKHLSTCVYGKNLQPSINKFKKKDIWKLDTRYKHIDIALDECINKIQPLRYLCRALIRTSFKLVNHTVYPDIWTKDLYQCQKYFCKVYPEKKEVMTRAFEIACLDNEEDIDREPILEFVNWLKNKLLTNKLEIYELDN